MRPLERYSYEMLKNFVALSFWLSSNNLTLEDVNYDLTEFENRSLLQAANVEAEELEMINKDPKLKDNVPWCDECGGLMRAYGSEKDECESELRCKNSHAVCLDISVMDFNVGLNAKIRGEKPEFEPEDIRASEEERIRRRNICRECEHLDGVRCKKCGCAMKHRTYYEILNCPDKRW